MQFSSLEPSQVVTWFCTILYLLSGVCQPLIMTIAKKAGLADSSAQLYMFFYYLGPSLLILTLCHKSSPPWPSRSILLKAMLIASIDIFAQGLNYTGAALAGPTIFSIIYSTVTIWTAVFSCLLLHRLLSIGQWLAVFCVFLGLAVTALDSTKLGPEVIRGTIMVVLGSMMHGATYVLSEAIMTVTNEQLTVRQNVAVQGSLACLALGMWQLVYTLPRFAAVVERPMAAAGTSTQAAVAIMTAFGIANLIHSVTFSHTLKYFPGGATSAGVIKGLQAVLVFVASNALYCGRVGGPEMCFTHLKRLSLIIVSSGVAIFGILNKGGQRKFGYTQVHNDTTIDTDLVV